MFKKLSLVLVSLLVLAACSGKHKVKIDMEGPTRGPDETKLTPSYGPNDAEPVTTAPTTDQPAQPQ